MNISNLLFCFLMLIIVTILNLVIVKLTLLFADHTRRKHEKYLYSHKAEEWSAEKEKRYNVILMQEVYNDGGKDLVQLLSKDFNHKCYTMFVPHHSLNDALYDERYQFTEKEIEDVKSFLPLNMQQIIDLGKVEVKND